VAKKDRFNLESDIMQVWNMVEDIDMLMCEICDSERFKGLKSEDADKIANRLMGIKEIYDMRCERLWDTFIEVNQLDRFNGID
jgi:hypothetical protein|tara:strand:+ start:2008 stop:2256 length:249 start_codon:yes stop_codon:yes gene_type:complete